MQWAQKGSSTASANGNNPSADPSGASFVQCSAGKYTAGLKLPGQLPAVRCGYAAALGALPAALLRPIESEVFDALGAATQVRFL